MWVYERSTGADTMVFEEDHVLDATIALEEFATNLEGSEGFGDLVMGFGGWAGVVLPRFDDTFVVANAGHGAVEAVGLDIEFALFLEGGEAVVNDAHL